MIWTCLYNGDHWVTLVFHQTVHTHNRHQFSITNTQHQWVTNAQLQNIKLDEKVTSHTFRGINRRNRDSRCNHYHTELQEQKLKALTSNNKNNNNKIAINYHVISRPFFPPLTHN